MSELLTDAGGHGRAALLVPFGAAVAGDARDTVLAGALACGLVACLACCAHRVAVTSWRGGVGGRCQRGMEGGGADKRDKKYQFIKPAAKCKMIRQNSSDIQ